MSVRKSVRRSATAGVAALGLALGVAGLVSCSGGDQDLAAAQTAPPPYSALLARTSQSLVTATSVRFRVTSSNVPSGPGSTLLLTGGGLLTRPTPTTGAFRGSADLLINNRRTTMKLVSYRDTFYVKLEGATRYQVIDPTSFAVFDPTVLVKAKAGLSSLVSGLKAVQDKGITEVDGVRLHSLHGEVTGLLADRMMPIADVYRPVEVDLQLDEETGQVRDVSLTGNFFDKNRRSTYRIELSRWNEKATITAPPT